MSAPVTISDIAQKLNLTKGSVSRALRNDPRISEATKQRVLKTARQLNYTMNNVASSLRSGKTKVIGVVIPSAEINFFGSVVHGIESLANQRGYNVLIYQSNESNEAEIRGLETFVNARVEGILVSIAKNTKNYDHFTALQKKNIPLVFFDRSNEKLNVPSVVINDFQGAYIATSHLIEQGYRRVAHISGPQHLEIFNNRLKGYKAALKAHKIKLDPALIFKGDVSIEAGREAIKHFFLLKNPPDAVFAVEDFTALGALKELKEQKIKVPTDFGVIGFANEVFGQHITPSLSSFDQQTVLMGQQALTLLLELIEQKGTKPKKRSIVLDPLPVFRESSSRKN